MKRILFVFVLSSLYSTLIIAGGQNLTVEKNLQALAQTAAQARSGFSREATIKTVKGDFVSSILSNKEKRQLRKSESRSSSLSPVQSPAVAAVAASL